MNLRLTFFWPVLVPSWEYTSKNSSFIKVYWFFRLFKITEVLTRFNIEKCIINQFNNIFNIIFINILFTVRNHFVLVLHYLHILLNKFSPYLDQNIYILLRIIFLFQILSIRLIFIGFNLQFFLLKNVLKVFFVNNFGSNPIIKFFLKKS